MRRKRVVQRRADRADGETVMWYFPPLLGFIFTPVHAPRSRRCAASR